MSTLVEIQEAITALPQTEREALSAWLASQSPPTIAPADEAELLKSLDAATRDLDAGRFTSVKDARRLVALCSSP